MGVILLTQNTFKRNRDTMPLVLRTGGMTCGTAVSERKGTRLWSSSCLVCCGIVITISSFFYIYFCSTIVMNAFFSWYGPPSFQCDGRNRDRGAVWSHCHPSSPSLRSGPGRICAHWPDRLC